MAAVSDLERFGLPLGGGSKSNDSVVLFGLSPPLIRLLMKKKTAASMARPTVLGVSCVYSLGSDIVSLPSTSRIAPIMTPGSAPPGVAVTGAADGLCDPFCSCSLVARLGTGLCWTELGWTALGCTELGCTELGWTKLGRAELGWLETGLMVGSVVATRDELISVVDSIGASGISEVVAMGRGTLVVRAGSCDDFVVFTDGVG